LLVAGWPLRGANPVRIPEPAQALVTLQRGHPRLFLDDAGLTRLRETIRTDETAARYFTQVVAEADALARILEPTGSSFSQMSAEQKPPQHENKGVRRLMVRRAGTEGSLRIAVLLAPVWDEGATSSPSPIIPLAAWKEGSP